MHKHADLYTHTPVPWRRIAMTYIWARQKTSERTFDVSRLIILSHIQHQRPQQTTHSVSAGAKFHQTSPRGHKHVVWNIFPRKRQRQRLPRRIRILLNLSVRWAWWWWWWRRPTTGPGASWSLRSDMEPVPRSRTKRWIQIWSMMIKDFVLQGNGDKPFLEQASNESEGQWCHLVADWSNRSSCSWFQTIIHVCTCQDLHHCSKGR